MRRKEADDGCHTVSSCTSCIIDIRQFTMKKSILECEKKGHVRIK